MSAAEKVKISPYSNTLKEAMPPQANQHQSYTNYQYLAPTQSQPLRHADVSKSYNFPPRQSYL